MIFLLQIEFQKSVLKNVIMFVISVKIGGVIIIIAKNIEKDSLKAIF